MIRIATRSSAQARTQAQLFLIGTPLRAPDVCADAKVEFVLRIQIVGLSDAGAEVAVVFFPTIIALPDVCGQ